MTVRNLVLSLFRGIGILDLGFEEEGYCVVAGPDLIWGSDIRDFHAPASVFEDVIGGPPCQCFSRIKYLNPLCGNKTGNLIPEFERIVVEAQPDWFIMENVREAPIPNVPGYQIDPSLFNNRYLGEKENRIHRFCFGTRDGRKLTIDPSDIPLAMYPGAGNCSHRGSSLAVRWTWCVGAAVVPSATTTSWPRLTVSWRSPETFAASATSSA